MDLPREVFTEKGFVIDPMSLLPVGMSLLAGIKVVEEKGEKKIKVLWVKAQGFASKPKPKPVEQNNSDDKHNQNRNIVEDFEDITIEDGGF